MLYSASDRENAAPKVLDPSNLDSNNAIPVADGAIVAPKVNQAKKTEGPDETNTTTSSLPVLAEAERVEDDDGNVRIRIKMVKKTVSSKVNKTIDESSEVMTKACTMTVVVAVCIILMWLVLDRAGVKFFYA